MKLYQAIAQTVMALENSRKANNEEWVGKHDDRIKELAENNLPSGSGFDSGCEIDTGLSSGEKVVIHTSYHCMNENGYYDGWLDYTIVVKPSLLFGFSTTIKGKNDRNDTKDYVAETIHEYLDSEVA